MEKIFADDVYISKHLQMMDRKQEKKTEMYETVYEVQDDLKNLNRKYFQMRERMAVVKVVDLKEKIEMTEFCKYLLK